MRDGDKYRFNLQFTADSEAASLVGETLEKAGKRKSQIVVAAVKEYIDNHPDVLESCQSITPHEVYKTDLEQMIRAIVDEKLSEVNISSTGLEENRSVETLKDEIDTDVLTMLGNLKMFD